MNLYEISATLENGAVHKTKIYEINQERALNRASKFALQFDATGCAKKTVQLIQKNAGVSKDTERAFLNEIKEILEGLGENSYCAMAFEGCVEDAEENIDNDFAVSMKGRWESEKKAHEETREGLIGKLNDRIKRVAELEAEVQKAHQMEAQARKEAAEDKIALEKAREKILPDNVATELTIMLRKQADEAAKEALYYADRMAAEVENSVPVGLTSPNGTSSISQLLYGSFSFPFSGQFLLLQIYLFQLSHRYLSLSHHLLQLRPAVQHVLLLILKIQVHS